MDIDGIVHLTSTDLAFYFVGAAALIATPPLVGALLLRFLFSSMPANGAGSIGRLLGALGLGLSVAFALGATGISLLRPASPDLFIALIILCLIFAMLGAGKLYWTEE